MRFEKPVPVPKLESTGESSKKLKQEDVDNDSDTEINMLLKHKGFEGVEGSSDYTEKVFFLGGKGKPTARRPTWRYKWRGSETGG
jgi:hypothetical protein